jgi:DNA-binding NarL/FixJ family response regulator
MIPNSIHGGSEMALARSWTDPVRLLIADDHEIVRKGLRIVLETQHGWTVAAEAINGKDAVEKAKQVKPHVAIMDITMPSMNGLEAARQIIKYLPETKILILSIHESDALIQRVLETGAGGYLLKSDATRDLVSAVEALLHNKTFFTSKVEQIVLEGYLGKRANHENPDEIDPLRLTTRQREIVQLLAEGKSNKEVATSLDISVKTAETHRANIMRRLDCHSVTALVRYAVRNHIIEA